MYQAEVQFEELKDSDLFVDCIYKGGHNNNGGDDPIINLLGTDAGGGFRKRIREDDPSKYAYIALYTTMDQLEWPDFLDIETGVFRYYGDNRKAGKEIHDTPKKGNLILDIVFKMLNSGKYDDIPPFFIFKKHGEKGRDVKFLGLAAPGNPKISPDKDLVAFWRTVKDNRFQNYEAYFTILDTGTQPISKKWINTLISDHKNSIKYAPKSWKKFIESGRNGIKPLCAPKNYSIPTKYEQLQCDNEGKIILEEIRKHYRKNPYGFEKCATEIIKKMDFRFENFTLTRPWRDGGRDAIGLYSISSQLNSPNYPLKFECSLEAKCFSENVQVNVKHMSRLISRIKYRQFGIIITTGSVNSQAYKEVIEDGHPILIITASDIASILKSNSINKDNITSWLNTLDERERAIAEFE